MVKEISASPFRLDGGSMRINNGLNRGTLKMGVNHHIDKTEMFFKMHVSIELVVQVSFSNYAYQCLAFRLR